MASQVERSQSRSKFARAKGTEGALEWTWLAEGDPGVFVGYETEVSDSKLLAVRRPGGENDPRIEFLLEPTPFYAESGGQVGDHGAVTGADFEIRLEDVQKEEEAIVHQGRLVRGAPKAGSVRAEVDHDLRSATRRNHTATHLLHAALRKVLGTHVLQQGSLVSPDRLRF